MAHISQTARELRLSRQAALMPPPTDISVLIVGVGGIGSNAAHLVASMGFEKITLIDPDTVAEENLYPGFFHTGQVNYNKADEVALELESRYGISAAYYSLHMQELDPEDFANPFNVMIVSTDTLYSRQQIWRMRREVCTDLYIDARMGAHLATVYAVDMDDNRTMAAYSQELDFDNREGKLACGEKATAPLTKGWIMGMVGKALFNYVNHRQVPFMQRYDLQVGMFNRIHAPLEVEEVNESDRLIPTT